MTAAEFERRYRREGDPWSYRSSSYEAAKYAATLAACGPGPFSSALELGGSIGVFSALLAPRCEQLTSVDLSATAVAAARRELAGFPQARALVGEIPGALDDGAYDLIVASEILYYLEPDAFGATLNRLEDLLVRGGRMVLVHWRKPGPDRPFTAREVHHHVIALDWLRLCAENSTPDYLLHALRRR